MGTEWKKGVGVKWETFGGDKYEGTVVEVDNRTLIVKCIDGVTRAVNGE